MHKIVRSIVFWGFSIMGLIVAVAIPAFTINYFGRSNVKDWWLFVPYILWEIVPLILWKMPFVLLGCAIFWWIILAVTSFHLMGCLLSWTNPNGQYPPLPINSALSQKVESYYQGIIDKAKFTAFWTCMISGVVAAFLIAIFLLKMAEQIEGLQNPIAFTCWAIGFIAPAIFVTSAVFSGAGALLAWPPSHSDSPRFRRNK